MQAAVVFNPVKADERALRKAIHAVQPGDWAEPIWLETSADDAGRAAVVEALESEPDLVIVAGGDGTIRVAADVLAGTDTPLAIIPAGTGNLLARNLGIDVTFLRLSVRNAYFGVERRIDLAHAEYERPDGSQDRAAFAVMAGFGLDAQMLEETDDQQKKRVGWLAYVAAFLRAFRKIERVRMRYRIDDERMRVVGVNTFIVGNCGVLQGRVVLLPDAAIDDGKLDVAIVRPNDAYGWLQVVGVIAANSALLHRVLRRKRIVGSQRSVPTLGYGQCESVSVRLDEPRHMQLDGDPSGEVIAMRCTVDRGSLLVRAPR